MFARLFGLATIAPRELHQRLQREPVVVFDVNSRQSFEAAHVPGATHLDPLTFGAGELPASRDSSLVFYCSNPFCRKAPNAARRAASLGYPHVLVMSAGIKGWIDAGLPTET